MLLRGARLRVGLVRGNALIRRLHVGERCEEAARSRARGGSVTAATGRPDTGDMYADAAALADKEMQQRGHARAASAAGAGSDKPQAQAAPSQGGAARDEQYLSEEIDASTDSMGAAAAGAGPGAPLRLSDDEFVKVACDLLDDICDGVLESQAGAGGFRVAVSDGELRVEVVGTGSGGGGSLTDADGTRLASGDASPDAAAAAAAAGEAAGAGDGSVLTLRPDVERQVVALVLPDGQELHYFFDAVARDWMPASAAARAGAGSGAATQAPPLIPELLRQFRLLSEVKPLF